MSFLVQHVNENGTTPFLFDTEEEGRRWVRMVAEILSTYEGIVDRMGIQPTLAWLGDARGWLKLVDDLAAQFGKNKVPVDIQVGYVTIKAAFENPEEGTTTGPGTV